MGLFSRGPSDPLPARLRSHFGSNEIVTAARTFPEYARVDLCATLSARFPKANGTLCLGVRRAYDHTPLTYADLLDTSQNPVSVAPLQFDQVDVGGTKPASCVKTGLWLVPGPTSFAVLLAAEGQFGCNTGWRVEVAVPDGPAGEEIVRSLFVSLEEAIAKSATYRGKVLSLEKQRGPFGGSAAILVHKLAPVAREEVILPEKTLALLERNVFQFAKRRPELRKLGLPVKKGLLFYGPPGTGKTHTVRYLAGALPEHTTLLITAEQVAIIDQYMILARLLAPSLVVIEDADLIAREREQMRDAIEEVLLNRLLNEMDGLRENTDVFFILSSNRPEALESALTARPGRIDQALEFPLPDADGRRKLARLYARGVSLGDEILEHVVRQTERVSASFIRELMRRSTQFALERSPDANLDSADIDAALDELLFSGGRLNAALLGASDRVKNS